MARAGTPRAVAPAPARGAGLSRRSSGRAVGFAAADYPPCRGFACSAPFALFWPLRDFSVTTKKAIFRRALRPCSMTLVCKAVYARKMCISTVADPRDDQKPSLNWLVSFPIKRGLLSSFLHLIQFCLYKNINICIRGFLTCPAFI